MRAIFILPALLLAACAAGGGIVNPKDMTPADRCFSAQVIVAGMEANDVAPATLDRARANAEFICSLAPVEGPLPRPAE
jgi:hypothetical protein